MEVDLNGKKVEIKELTYLEGLEIADAQKAGAVEGSKMCLKKCTDLSDEDIEKLSIKDGLKLQTAINEVNSLDFQQPAESKEN